MAAPAYATDLVDIFTSGTTTGWSALGGGPAGLSQETDYYIQGTSCLSKAAFASSTRGMIYNNGAGVTIPADGAVLMWMVNWTPNSMDTRAAGGHQVVIGSATTAYKHFYVDGSDTNTFGGWLLAAVDPAVTADETTGTPSATRQYFGALSKMVGGPTKGSPFGIDAIRYGRCELRCTDGETANYATFAGANAFGDTVTRRWGLLSFTKGTYFMSGLFLMGLAGTPVDFRDSNRVIFLRDHQHAPAAFTGFEVRNSSSVVQWTNISVSALGVTTKGRWLTTAGTVTLADCQFIDMDTFSFLATDTITSTIWRRCNTITAPGTTMTDCEFAVPSVATNTSAVVWNVATDTAGKLDGSLFSRGANAHHAIELGTSSPTTVTLADIEFTGFNASNNQDDSVLHIKRTTGTVTINLSGVTGTVSYRTDGATVELVAATTLTLTGLRNSTEVRVFDAGTTTEIAGQESVTSGTFSAGLDSATYPSVDIAIISLGYQNLRLLGVSVTSDVSIPIQQVIDRQYLNP